MKKKPILQTLRQFTQTRYFLVLEGIAAGIAAGLVTVLVRAALSREDQWLQAALAFGER